MTADQRTASCGCGTCDEARRAARLAADGNWTAWLSRHMVVCDLCGNKRCPHAEDHNLRCTGSNEPDQMPERVA